MAQLIDPSAFDLRFQTFRLQWNSREAAMAMSLTADDIRSPLVGIGMADGTCILLDGFKRLRAANALQIQSLPFESLGSIEVEGLLEFLRRSVASSLNILEQSAFIKYLASEHGFTVGQIARDLDKSKGWVSMRRTLIDELSETVRRKVFAGHFPVYAYMYFLRPFMRMNEASASDIDRFVLAVSGKRLSTREIERLAYGYFKGPLEFRMHIERGEIAWALKRSLGLFKTPMPSCSAMEISVLQDLERLEHDIKRVQARLTDHRLKNLSFFAQASLLAAKLFERLPSFTQSLKVFHDRSRNA